MRWQGREGSSNVEDRRGMKMAAAAGGGGLLVVILGALFALMNGADPLQVAQQAGMQLRAAPEAVAERGAGQPRADDALAEFTSVVLKDTEDVWNRLFPQLSGGRAYVEPGLVLFDGRVETRGCGSADSNVGPFYCGGDSKVYIDLSFFQELQTKFQAPGEFACAYVIAHEVGHHVQNLVGLLEQVERQRRSQSKVEANRTLVRLELHADYLAGVWAHHAHRMKGILEAGDIQCGLAAAAAVGDDTLQRRSGGRVVPDAFTHGTSDQRTRWFRLGLETGDLAHFMDPFELPYEEL
jgi:predicted metalloprotease